MRWKSKGAQSQENHVTLNFGYLTRSAPPVFASFSFSAANRKTTKV
jgi:hypothetical protein